MAAIGVAAPDVARESAEEQEEAETMPIAPELLEKLQASAQRLKTVLEQPPKQHDATAYGLPSQREAELAEIVKKNFVSSQDKIGRR